MPCAKCGSNEPTTEQPVQDGTLTSLKQLCAGCATKEGKEPMPQDTEQATVPVIRPAIPPRNETEAFMQAGSTAPLAQTEEAVDQNIKQFNGVQPEPIVPSPAPTAEETGVAETVSPQPPETTGETPHPNQPVTITADEIVAKINQHTDNIEKLQEVMTRMADAINKSDVGKKLVEARSVHAKEVTARAVLQNLLAPPKEPEEPPRQ